jgi:hypothetical protein
MGPVIPLCMGVFAIAFTNFNTASEKKLLIDFLKQTLNAVEA